ncbi:hypothetical protein SAMN05421824_0824 [Hyunsoonleella jejuensis]|uniref:Uncharacterized protein n=1 Tax=Hyunsoonleella jejuensis TaxID=419940 RepID=A0A1H9C7T3_9FLAO|nr:hypothetical protein SAMN05421824_0824 [Hyunsoonleella jejuensis]
MKESLLFGNNLSFLVKYNLPIKTYHFQFLDIYILF